MSKRGRKVKRRGNKQMALCDISGCSSVVEFSRMRRFPPMELVQERVAWWAALYGRLNFRLTAASAGQLSVCPKHFTSPRRLRNEHPAPVLALPLRTVQPPPIPTELVREDAGAVRTYSRRGDAQAAAAATGTGAPPRYKTIAPALLPAPPPTSTVIGWPVGQRAVAAGPMPAAAVVSRLVPAQQQQQQQFHIVPAGQASVTPAPGSFQVMSAGGSASAAGGGGVIQLVAASGAGGVSGGGGAMQLLPTSSGQLLLMQSGQRAAQQVLAQTSGMSLVMVNSNGQPAPQPQQKLRLALPRLPRPPASEQQRGGRRGRASSMTITSVQSESGTPAAAVAEEDDDIQVMDVAFGLPVSEIRPKTEVIDLHDDDGSDAAMSDAGAACDSSAVVQAVAAAQGDEEASTVTVKSESSNDEQAPLLPKLEPVCKLEESPAETAISGPSVIRLKPLSELTSAVAAERGSSAVQPPRIPTPPGISLGSGVGPKSEAELMLLSMQAREAQRKEQQQQQQREQQQQQQQQQKRQQQQQQQQREQQQQQQQQQKRQKQQQQKLRQAFRNRLHRLQEQSIQQQQQQQLRQTFPDQLHRVQQLSRQQTETQAQQGRPASSGAESAPPAKRARTQEDPAPVSATDRPPNTAAVNGPSAAADGADDNARPSLEVARRAVEVCRITREVRGAHASDWQLSEALSDLLTGQQLSDWSAAAQALRSASYHETLVGLISHFVASEKLDATEPQRPPPEPVKSPEPVVSSERADSPERTVSLDPANRDGQGDPDDPSPPADDPDQPPTPTPNGRESPEPTPPPEDVKPTFSLPAGLSITLLAPVEHPAQTEPAGGGDSGGGGGDSDEDETAPDGVNGFSIIPVNQPAQLKPSALPPASPASTPAAPPAPPAPAAPARPSLAAAPAPAALLVRAPAAPPGAPVAPARLSVAAAYLARPQAPPQAPVERKITWKDRKQCVRLVRCYLCSAGNFASWTMVHQHLQTYHGESDILFPDTIRFNGGCLVVCALCSDVTPTACHSQSHALERHGQVVNTAPAVICCAECHRVSDLARGCGLLHTELCRWRHGAEPAAGHCVYTCEPCELELHAGPGGTVYQHITAHSVGAVGAPSRCQLCEFRGVFVACQQHVLREHASRCRLLGCARCPQFCTNNWQEAERHVFERHVSRAGSPHGSSQPHAPRTTPCPVCGMALVGKETMLAQHMHMHRYSELAARRPGPRSRTRPDAPVALLPPGDADLVKPSLDELQDVWRDEDDCKLTMETRVTVKRLPQPTWPG